MFIVVVNNKLKCMDIQILRKVYPNQFKKMHKGNKYKIIKIAKNKILPNCKIVVFYSIL